MQQPGGMFPVMPSFPPTNITTEQIQKYLDENKKLILAILDNQNLGKLAECAQYQAQLQKNLMYLAAIADAQPQSPAMPPQMTPHPAMQQGGFYMQHPHTAAAAMAQQPGVFAARAPPFSSPHSIQDLQQQQQQQHLQNQPLLQGQMGMRPVGATNGMHPPSNDTNLGGNKQDNKTGGGPGSDGQGNSAFGGVGGGGGGGGDGEAGK